MATESRTPAKTEAGRQGAPVPYRPWDPFQDLRGQIDRVFEDFFGGFPRMPGAFTQPAMMPDVDVSETDNAVVIAAELPGMDKGDVDITLSEGVLTLKGEKRGEKEEKGRNYYLSERSYGSFNRSFRLPPTVDQEKVEASFDKGVLTITLPKTEQAQSAVKKIEVRGS